METCSNVIMCPVCTLFLRPGITLKQHLASHPKQKVIEALVRISYQNDKTSNLPEISIPGASQSNPSAAFLNQVPMGTSQNVPVPANHLFIYQQCMSTTSPQQSNNVLSMSPINQQYVVPTVFAPQMMPYVYQQQQVILASNGIPNMLALPPILPKFINEPEKSTEKKLKEVESDLTQECEISEKSQTKLQKRLQSVCESEVIVYDDNLHPPLKIEQNEISQEKKGLECVVDLNTGEEEEMEEREEFQSSDVYEESRDNIDHEEYVETPLSESSEWRYQEDGNKSCQTQTAIGSPSSLKALQEVEHETEKSGENGIETIEDEHQEQPEYFYFEQHLETEHILNSRPFATIEMTTGYEPSDPIYTSTNVLHRSESMDFVNLDEIDNMQVIISNFSGGPVVSHVNSFENTQSERPGVLMNIGEVNVEKNNYADHNVNIRSDEKMPPRGELSGQESISSSSDVTWNQMPYHDSNSNSVVYSAGPWDDSNSVIGNCEGDLPSLQSRVLALNNCDDKPTLVDFSGPPLKFKCSNCDEAFASTKARKDHESEVHPEKVTKRCSLIGLDINKKNTKKLIIKPKPQKTENNFDNVLSSTLKSESFESNIDVLQAESDVKVDIKPDISQVILPKPIRVKAVCATCDGVFTNKKSLRLHQIEKHGVTTTRSHQCGTCGEVFPNEYKYNEHLKLHPLECRMCGKLFHRRQNMQLHMKRHLGFKPFKCEICPKSFVTKQKHDEHRNTHTGFSPIKCSLCEETFKRHSNLVQHRNRHHYNVKKKVKDYICFCGEIFHSSKKLAWHKEIHDVKPKACSECSEKFVHMTSLTRHMRRAHNAEYLPEERKKQINSECHICKGTFLRSSLDAHIKNHTGARPYSCLTCHKDFTTKWNLKLHKWTHASRTQKPFKCDQCRGAFIRESDYIAHMNSHRSVRPYTCNYCGAQFIRKYNCQRHVKEHENNKTFNCDVCGKSFHRSYYLKDHMRVHSGDRPYSCHICGKTSTTKSNHNKHIQIHHAREPVSTEN